MSDETYNENDVSENTDGPVLEGTPMPGVDVETGKPVGEVNNPSQDEPVPTEPAKNNEAAPTDQPAV